MLSTHSLIVFVVLRNLTANVKSRTEPRAKSETRFLPLAEEHSSELEEEQIEFRVKTSENELRKIFRFHCAMMSWFFCALSSKLRDLAK